MINVFKYSGLGISKESEEYKDIYRYLQLMLEKNRCINLTNITDINIAELLHIEDSLVPYIFLKDYIAKKYVFSDIRLADIGSGCGFPGVALSIALSLHATLVDSVSKKINAINSILKEIDLHDQIKTISKRIEEVAELVNSDELSSFHIVTARALSSLPSILELSSPLVQHNGLFIAYKGSVDESEFTSGLKVADIVGFELISKISGLLSDDKTFRNVYIFKKVGNSQIDLPRRNGLAQKRPLA